jgi:hypothetical protein
MNKLPRYFRVHKNGLRMVCVAESSEELQKQYPGSGVSEVSPFDLQTVLAGKQLGEWQSHSDN